MPRPRKAAPQLTAGQASFVLERLISNRRVSAGEINRYLGEMQKEIASLEQRLQSLRTASSGAASPARRPGRPPRVRSSAGSAASPAKARGRKRSKVLTPEQRASRQLQGRYLALVRQIPANKRAGFSRMTKEKGREAAIKAMTEALKK